MSSPSVLLAEKEKELEERRKQIAEDELALEKEKEEKLQPPASDEEPVSTEETKTLETSEDKEEITDQDVIAPSPDLDVKSEESLPTFEVSSDLDVNGTVDFPFEPVDDYPDDIFVGGRCPHCKIQLTRENLLEKVSGLDLAFYKCKSDNYILTMSH